MDDKLGKLNEEMVMNMNFGGGAAAGQNEDPENKKSRKEVFEEIIAKSKAYKMAKYEVKEAAKELTSRLDNQFQDILPLLNMSKVKQSTREPVAPELDSYEQIAAKLKEQQKVIPNHVLMGEKEQARMRKQKLEALQEEEQAQGKTKLNRREEKEIEKLDKRERAFERALQEQKEKHKNELKVKAVEGKVKEQLSKLKKGDREVDSDLASDDEDEGDYDEEYDDEEEGEDDDSQGEGDSNDDNSDEDDDEDYGSEDEDDDEDSN